MSDQTAQPSPFTTNTDPYKKLQIVRNEDGSITRSHKLPEKPASRDPNLLPSSTPALSKDVPVDQSKKTWLRIFLPRQALDSSFSPSSKLPLIVYFHGGGFMFLSAASSEFHNFCTNSAAYLSAVVASVEYRLAPENRLPAAYEDAMDALQWIRAAEDDWLRDYADLSSCYLMGDSAGGNIAYHAGLRAAAEAERLEPMRIRGMILQQPFFGGVRRSGSELRLVNDRVFPLSASDLAWELSLPIGVDRDHEYSNPTVDGGSKMLNLIKRLEWKVLVTGWDGDPLFDRQAEVAKMLDEKGVKVVAHFGVGEYHGVEIIEPSKAELLFLTIKKFMSS